MSEELIQRNLIEAPEKMGDWNFYNIGATTLKALKGAKIIPDKDYEAYEGKKPDALIVKKPIIIGAIEYKTPQELRTEKQIAKAIAQEIGTAQILQANDGNGIAVHDGGMGYLHVEYVSLFSMTDNRLEWADTLMSTEECSYENLRAFLDTLTPIDDFIPITDDSYLTN